MKIPNTVRQHKVNMTFLDKGGEGHEDFRSENGQFSGN